MKRLLKTGSIIAVMALCAGLLTGCGEKAAEWKIGKEARYYIANKYGFRPGTTGVELKKVGDLEGVWHKKDGGTAAMEYKGRTFNVYVSLTDPDIRYDDYLKPDVEEYLSGYFETSLDCSDIHILVTYGVPACMVPGDTKTVDDIFEKCDNIQIYVSTFGLDADTAQSLDVTELGTGTEIYIIDWTAKEYMSDEELTRETIVGFESDSYTDGFSKAKSCYKYSNGNLSILKTE